MNAIQVDGDRRSRLPALTGLRFFAALVVVGFHLVIDGPVAGPVGEALRTVFQQGPVGVSFFFVLSGFVLAWSAQPGDRLTAFWRRRAARIVPSHVLCWAVALAAALAVSNPPSVGAAMASLTLVQAWSPDPTVHYAVNAVSWSLSCEMVFYLLFPFLLPVVWGGTLRRTWLVLGLVVTGSVLVALVAPLAEPRLTYWYVYLFPLDRLLEFVAGMAAARLVAQGSWPRWRWSSVAIWVLAAYVVSIHVPVSLRPVAVTLVPLVALVGSLARAEAAGGRSWLSRPLMVRLGEISFALYLVHQIILRLAARAIGPVEQPGLAAVVAVVLVGASMAAAWLVHQMVEEPFVARLARRRVPPAPVRGAIDAPAT